jgi:hypothetical protein
MNDLYPSSLPCTAAALLASLLTVDGAGSGLDADLLDGFQASAFGQVAQANTWTARQVIQGAASSATPLLSIVANAGASDQYALAIWGDAPEGTARRFSVTRGGNAYIDGTLTVASTTPSTSTTTGGAIFACGVGIAGAVWGLGFNSNSNMTDVATLAGQAGFYLRGVATDQPAIRIAGATAFDLLIYRPANASDFIFSASNGTIERQLFRLKESGSVLLGTTVDGMTASGSLAIAQDLAHRGSKAGFFNATPITKPTATGSRGGNAALASALTALANLGLITDGTSA